MIKEVTAAGKDILEAKENARVALGTGELEDVQFEIIDAGTKGLTELTQVGTLLLIPMQIC